MANILHLTVENPDELLNAGAYGAGAVIRVQTATTKAGAYADVTGTGSTPTIALVAATLTYDGFDPNGTSASWYRIRYEDAATTRTSDWAASFQVAGLEAYASLATFRNFLRSASVGDDDDDPDSPLQSIALVAAARAIDVACGRTFYPAASTVSSRYFTFDRPTLPDYPVSTYPGTWYQNAVLAIDDVFDSTGMLVHFDTSGDATYATATTAYRLGPVNAAARSLPYTQLVFNTGTYPPTHLWGVRVQALWGWDVTPPTIVQANLIQAARFLKRRDAAFGVAGSPDMGNELRLLAKLDPDVALMVGNYKRNWGAV
jgi:hypothetical protein